MKVTHRKTGRQGIIVSAVRGTIRVIFPDGSDHYAYSSSYTKTGGCLGTMIAFITVPLITAASLLL